MAFQTHNSWSQSGAWNNILFCFTFSCIVFLSVEHYYSYRTLLLPLGVAAVPHTVVFAYFFEFILTPAFPFTFTSLPLKRKQHFKLAGINKSEIKKKASELLICSASIHYLF